MAYRIAQEAVTNVLKHAGPSARADVRVRFLEDGVEVEVTDDGHGERAPRKHVGQRPGPRGDARTRRRGGRTDRDRAARPGRVPGAGMAADDLTIVLADDQDLVRAGFRVILESEPGLRVVGEARDGAEAVAAVVALRPDVVCLDVQMPNVDGLEAARRIAALSDPPAVLVLTTFDSDDALFQSLEAVRAASC